VSSRIETPQSVEDRTRPKQHRSREYCHATAEEQEDSDSDHCQLIRSLIWVGRPHGSQLYTSLGGGLKTASGMIVDVISPYRK